MPCHLSTYGTQNKECTSPEMALWRLSDHGAVFQHFFQNISAIFVNMQSDFDLSCSFCEYSFVFHCLHCSPSCFDPDSLLLAHLWLGLSWIGCISANKTFYSSKTSSRKPYTSSKQQERHKHSVEITIKLSGSKRQTVSAYRQQPRAVHPVRRDQSYISRRANEDGHKERGHRREDSA